MGIFRRWFFRRKKQDDDGPDKTSLKRSVLSSCIANTQLMLMTASERSIKIDGGIIKTVLEAQDALDRNLMTPALATRFWEAYELLANSLSPITVDSIKATYDPQPHHDSILDHLRQRDEVPFARKCAFAYKTLSIGTLATLIVLQIFWSIGNTLVVDISKQTNRLHDLQKELFSVEDQTNATAGTTAGATAGSAASSGAKSGNDFSADQVAPSNIRELNRQIDEYLSWRDAEIIQLKSWNRTWGAAIFFLNQTWERPGYSNLSAEAKVRVHYVSAQYMLHAISSYMLPMLYGLLGASFYVLRQLPKEIEQLTFSPNSHIDYSLRITQGPLAGIMASFFFSDGPAELQSLSAGTSHAIATIKLGSTSLGNFSPLAIAFLAGYSVELIFYIIDKLISMATGKSSPAIKANISAAGGSPGVTASPQNTSTTPAAVPPEPVKAESQPPQPPAADADASASPSTSGSGTASDIGATGADPEKRGNK